MKKAFFCLMAAIFLCSCGSPDNTEIIDDLPITSASVTSAIKNENSIVIDMNKPLEGNETYYTSDILSDVEIRGCKSSDLSFLKGIECSRLTIYGFTGRAVDYAGLFAGLDLSRLTIYAEPKMYFPEDNELYREAVGDSVQLLYTAECYLDICGMSYPADTELISIDTMPDAEDRENLSRLNSPALICSDIDIIKEIFGSCYNIKALTAENYTDDISELVQALSGHPALESLYVSVPIYSSEHADMLISALPGCRTEYVGYGVNGEYVPDGICLFADPCIEPFSDNELHQMPRLFFSNGEKNDITVSGISISRCTSEGEVPCPFADGSYEYDPKLTVKAGDTMPYNEYSAYSDDHKGYVIPKDMFDCNSWPAGIYTVTARIGEAKLRTMFMLSNSTISASVIELGDNEKNTAFNLALDSLVRMEFYTKVTEEYASSHTPDEFLSENYPGLSHDLAYRLAEYHGIIREGRLHYAETGGRGSNLMLCGNYFSIISQTDNEIVLKNTVALSHGDDPYKLRLSSSNCRLILTPQGWKADILDPWY